MRISFSCEENGTHGTARLACLYLQSQQEPPNSRLVSLSPTWQHVSVTKPLESMDTIFEFLKKKKKEIGPT